MGRIANIDEINTILAQQTAAANPSQIQMI
jgi:hypothetical protein